MHVPSHTRPTLPPHPLYPLTPGGHGAGVCLRQEQGPGPAGGIHHRQPPGKPAGGGRQVGAPAHMRTCAGWGCRCWGQGVFALGAAPAACLCHGAHGLPCLPALFPPVVSLPSLSSPCSIRQWHATPRDGARRRCFEEGLYDAARIIYTRIPNYGRLASTLVRLHQFQAAVDAARKVGAAASSGVICLRSWPGDSLLALLSSKTTPLVPPFPSPPAGQLAAHLEGGGVCVRGGGGVQVGSALRPQHHHQRRRPHGGAPW